MNKLFAQMTSTPPHEILNRFGEVAYLYRVFDESTPWDALIIAGPILLSNSRRDERLNHFRLAALDTFGSAFGRSVSAMVAYEPLHDTFPYGTKYTRSLAYVLRLERNLIDRVGLRDPYIRLLNNHPPMSLRQLETDLRSDASEPRLLHLGPTEDGSPGFAFATIVSPHPFDEPHQRIFALLTIHPPSPDARELDNFPWISVRGFAS